jgi:Mrp family chromosome partitioning ATPase
MGLAPGVRLHRVRPETARLDVMVSGMPMPDSASQVESGRMTQLLLTLAPDYDLVVFDSGSALLDPNVIPLMKMVGGALIVGRLGVTSRDEAAMFRDDLRLLNVPALGVIVNEAAPVSRIRSLVSSSPPAPGRVARPFKQIERSPTKDRHAVVTSE